MFNNMFIDNGANLTPPLVKVIAIAPAGGGDATYIQKSQIRNFAPVYIPFVQASQANASYPFRDSCTMYIELNSGASIKFDVQACLNQPTWFTAATNPGGTATSPEAGLKQAAQDLASFL